LEPDKAQKEHTLHAGICFLCDLQPGQQARVCQTKLCCEDCDMLNALGFTDQCQFRVCKAGRAGSPCILKVGCTRIGLSASLTDKISVIPESDT